MSEVDYVGEVEEDEDLYIQKGANVDQGYYVYLPTGSKVIGLSQGYTYKRICVLS